MIADLPDVISPNLYLRLQRRFGRVLVAFPKTRAHWGRGTIESVKGRRHGMVLDDVGEQYRVNCPICQDQGNRLYISHLYGQPNPHDVQQRRDSLMTWPVRCWNEECFSGHPERLRWLADRILDPPTLRDRLRLPLRQPLETDETAPIEAARLPGETISLRELPANHQARRYLQSRGLDPDWLTDFYRVGFCIRSDALPEAEGRLITPIYFEGALIGWQGRIPDEWDWKKLGVSKYYTMPRLPKSRILYNWDRARRCRGGVLMEGTTGVWSVGDPGMCSLGKTLSPPQLRLLSEFDVLVLLYDGDMQKPEKQAGFRSVVEDLRQVLRERLVIAQLPLDMDPGDCRPTNGERRDFLWRLLDDAVEQAGLDPQLFRERR